MSYKLFFGRHELQARASSAYNSAVATAELKKAV